MSSIQEKEIELIFETRDLSKNFGPTVALDKVNIKIYRGEITGLIGENGSGKSTITSIAAGIQPASSGEMYFKGALHKPVTMIDGAEKGIGMIVQEQGTVSGITVAQNIFLGEEKQFKIGPFLSRGRMNRAAKKALEAIGLSDVDPGAYIDRLNMQDRKLVEIAKVIMEDPEMLVVDETTTALSHKGRDIIYDIMKKMKEQNKAVVFISHDLEELIEICDTLSILRDGELISTLHREEMEPDTIKKLMVGREMKGDYYRSDYEAGPTDEVVLKVDEITTGTGMLMNFSMEVYKGEILGIGGLSHCGMHELGRALYGEEKLLTGEVRYLPLDKKIRSPRESMKMGFGYVSKDRDNEALVLTASIRDNILVAGYEKVKKGPFLLPGIIKKYILEQIQKLSIKCASMGQDVQYLSGGNKQKVVFGKWLGRDCDVLILDCPTRGVDIGVKADMYQLINEMKKSGKTIVMISEELPELIGMSDRLIILKDGSFAGEFPRSPELGSNEIVEVMI